MIATGGISTVRLWILRATYLFVAVGLAVTIGPLLLDPPADLQHMRGVVWAMLAAVAVLAVVGLRHPVRMLPLLFFELTWKSIWLIALAWPRASAATLDAAWSQSVIDCVVGVAVCLVAIPWGYVWRSWVRGPGEPWRAPRAGTIAERPIG